MWACPCNPRGKSPPEKKMEVSCGAEKKMVALSQEKSPGKRTGLPVMGLAATWPMVAMRSGFSAFSSSRAARELTGLSGAALGCNVHSFQIDSMIIPRDLLVPGCRQTALCVNVQPG